MNWAQLQQNSDYRSIKERLSLASVVQAAGVALTIQGDRLVGLCPFHADSSASFAVWRTEEGYELCGCWSCDFRPSDLFTFLERKYNLTFAQAAKMALSYIDQGLPDSPPIPERVYDASESRMAVAEATEPTHAVYTFLRDRDMPVLDSWLVSEFRLGVDREGRIVIPHYGSDGELLAAKRRAPGMKPLTLPGGRLTALYGEWRDQGRRDVILCEGESDTWLVAWLWRDEDVDVVGLPSGVSAKPKDEWVDRFRGRSVTLLFDGDDAGRRGAASWAVGLHGAADQIRVASLADDHDACSAGSGALRVAVGHALTYRDLGTLAVTEVDSHYVKINAATGTGQDLSDFVFDVKSVTAIEGGQLYFDVEVDGWPHQLSSGTLSNSNKFRQWCMDRMLSWKGSSTTCAEVFERLKAYSVFTPRYAGTDVTGLHDGTFVLPDGNKIGSGGWTYVSEGAAVRAADQIKITKGVFDRKVLIGLAGMHTPEIMTPLLGWIAAAPLRSICSQFPILAVVGGAGFGKTTLIQTVLRSFSFWCASPMTLSSTTPHAVQSFVASTNAFPVWFDEYRKGARPEAKTALDQAIRDAWDGSSSVKGGYGENKVELRYLQATAPIIVTGEESFSETSHAERMVILSIGPHGRDVEALKFVESCAVEGLGYDYLNWLVTRMERDDFAAPPHIHDRHQQTLAICAWGYDLLQDYAGHTLPAFTAVAPDMEYKEMADNSPYVTLIREGAGIRDRNDRDLVWAEDNHLCVRRSALIAWNGQQGDGKVALPGGAQAFGTWMSQYFETQNDQRNYQGLFTRYLDAAYIING